MTNEERATLIAQGWTPPVPVDPDLNMARDYAHYLLGTIFEVPSFQRAQDYFLQAIKQGRALAAEAKPGMVWVKHDGSHVDPVGKNDWVWIKSYGQAPYLSLAGSIYWANVTHYAVIPHPAEDVA